MKRNEKILIARRIYWSASVLLLSLKTVADNRRHGTHGKHSQRCDCFTQCYSCMWDVMTGRDEKKDS